QATRQILPGHALDDVAHQRRLWGVIAFKFLTVLVLFEYAVDAWINKIRRMSRLIDQVFTHLPGLGICILPNTIRGGVAAGVFATGSLALKLAVFTKQLVLCHLYACLGRGWIDLLVVGSRAV